MIRKLYFISILLFLTNLCCGQCPTTVSDIDGNLYHVVQIGNQCWMQENLSVTRYSDGTPMQDGSLLTGAISIGDQVYYSYNNDTTNASIFGRLYTWHAAIKGNSLSLGSTTYPSNIQGVCPSGWHLPSEAEFDTLIIYLDPQVIFPSTSNVIFSVAGGLLKSLNYWSSPNANATNLSGFSALPSGMAAPLFNFPFNGNFTDSSFFGRFWSSSNPVNSVGNGLSFNLSHNNSGIFTDQMAGYYGLAVRCLTTLPLNNLEPTGSFMGSDTSICQGTCINFTNQSVRDSSWHWLFPGGTPSSSNLQTPPQVCYSVPGTYSVTLIVSNAFGSDTLTLSNYITVNAIPTAQASSNSPICAGENLNLTANGGTSYSWTGPNGFSSTLQNPSINSVATSNSGIYSVVVTNNNGCIDSSSVTVTINPNNPVTASSNSPVCEGQNLIMNASAGSTFSWTGPNGFISSLQNPTINNISTTASGIYAVSVTNACGTGSSSFTVQVSQRPTASISVASVVICEGDTLYLNATGGGTYNWSGPNNFSSNSQSPMLNYFTSANAGQYNVIVTNTDNCSDTSTVNISLNQSTCFFIPSVFTPNSDGFNDTWFIEGMWQYPNCVVKVFNRWGQKLFESKGYSTPWDGTAEGNDCPIADYYYVIDLQNNTRVLTGTITIKR